MHTNEVSMNAPIKTRGKAAGFAASLDDYVLTANLTTSLLSKKDRGKGEDPGRVTSAIRSPGGGGQPL